MAYHLQFDADTELMIQDKPSKCGDNSEVVYTIRIIYAVTHRVGYTVSPRTAQ